MSNDVVGKALWTFYTLHLVSSGHLLCFYLFVSAYLEGENITQLYQPHFLLELLELIFEQFRIVACTHQVVLANMQRVKVRVRWVGIQFFFKVCFSVGLLKGLYTSPCLFRHQLDFPGKYTSHAAITRED